MFPDQRPLESALSAPFANPTSFEQGSFTLRARWVFPVCAPPLENGVVEIAEGRIVAVHNRPGPLARDFGNAAIIPGLVNAHTHLELSDVAAPLDPAVPFTSWLRSVMKHRRSRASDLETALARAGAGGADRSQPGKADVQGGAAAGRAECAASGTTTIGDIAGVDWKPQLVAGPGPRVLAFRELLGLSPTRIEAALARAREHLAGGGLRGLSPHAPYSVHPDLLRQAVDLAVVHGAPVAVHLAETRAELELLRESQGEFIPFLEELGVWQEGIIPRGSRPLDYLRELARAPRALAIHGNYLDEEEIGFVAGCPNLSVIYCPRTHAYFRHDPHPWRRLLERGINVALGTDSRASNPDLSLWNELLFLRRLAPDLGPALLLELGTSSGARALGVLDETGTIEPGKTADLAIVELPPRDSTDPYALMFDPRSRALEFRL